ncbi:MAG TPA: hypothetical protein VKX41_19635 [Alloacidobacterium sp.]|nr:hypothetical protein [Alloacidobacterium sp.]
MTATTRGAEEAAALGREWAMFKGKVDPPLFEDVRRRLEYQAGARDRVARCHRAVFSQAQRHCGRARPRWKHPNRFEA